MDWTTLLGHDRQKDWFRNAIQSERLASTFLFVGPNGVGKRTFAKLLAKTLLCTRNPPSEFRPCGSCEACAQISASTHPDLIEIARLSDRTTLSIDQFIGPEDNRMREGLCYEIRMKPYSNRRKIAIVNDADTIGEEAANSLLKTLEEPPPGSVIVLISTSLQRQLPTIRSRCQVVRFQGLSPDNLATIALRNGWTQDRDQAIESASQSNGSLTELATLADEELREFQLELIKQLSRQPMDLSKYAKAIVSHLDMAGNDSQSKRDRLKLLIGFVQHHFRQRLAQSLNHDAVSVDRSLKAIQRCIEATYHVDRIIAPAALVEAWIADIATC
jgi:DNA polymerase III subunit delta'